MNPNKPFKGKAIYNPGSKAAEYSQWACNFYKGCQGMCTYCYNKKGITAKVLGGDKAVLKSCFKDETHALDVFVQEVEKNLPELKKNGLFFSFTSDFFYDTQKLLKSAIYYCMIYDIPVITLTKQTTWFDGKFLSDLFDFRNKIAFGFTLTGRDECEPGCNTNETRIKVLTRLKLAGFKTWASIEPILSIKQSMDMVYKAASYCNLFKVGLLSGQKYYKDDLRRMIREFYLNSLPVYFKDSFLKQAGINRIDLPANCVNSDYSLFK